MAYPHTRKFSELLGKTLTQVERLNGEYGDEIRFITDAGIRYRMCHHDDCCENVDIEDIAGNLGDLVGSPILMADEASSSDPTTILPLTELIIKKLEGEDPYESDDSQTWTFYKLATVKGYVTIRWYGISNGHYSESVDFEEIPNANEDA